MPHNDVHRVKYETVATMSAILNFLKNDEKFLYLKKKSEYFTYPMLKMYQINKFCIWGIAEQHETIKPNQAYGVLRSQSLEFAAEAHFWAFMVKNWSKKMDFRSFALYNQSSDDKTIGNFEAMSSESSIYISLLLVKPRKNHVIPIDRNFGKGNAKKGLFSSKRLFLACPRNKSHEWLENLHCKIIVAILFSIKNITIHP